MNRIAALLFVLVAVSTVASGQPVRFNDLALKAAVEAQLHVSNPTPADMARLGYLMANERGITDLTGLEQAVNLQTLNLSYNSLTNLSALAGLVNLNRLYLDGNAIANVSSLAQLGKLQFLSLSFNEIADISALAGLQGLTELNLSSNKIDSIKPLSGLVKLTQLDLSDNSISDISTLATLTNLTLLSVSYNQITDVSPLSSLTKLTELDLALNQITDITPLSGLSGLTELHLGNNRISDIAPLTKLTKMTLLAIEYDNPLLPVAYCVHIPRIRQNHPGLTLFYDQQPRLAAGDCTGDCHMDLADFALLAASWLQTGQERMAPDFSQDWTIDFRDLAILASHWLGPVIIREFRLDASPGWTVQGQWQFGPPQGRGGAQGQPDPNAGCTGTNVYGVNLAGDYDVAKIGSHILTSSPIDCSTFHNVVLTFSRWLNADDPSHVRSVLEVSTDGKSWQSIWQHAADSPLTDATWTPVSYDIRKIADGRPEVYLRWTCETLKGARPYSGWNIDDIIVWGRQ